MSPDTAWLTLIYGSLVPFFTMLTVGLEKVEHKFNAALLGMFLCVAATLSWWFLLPH